MKKHSKISILVCTHVHIGVQNKSCGGDLCLALVEQLKQQIIEQKLDISVREQACFGRCEEGIVARIYPCKDFFIPVTKKLLPKLIDMAKQNIEIE
ncbi:MAG: (2Fe-2S) ferredoxin domain-containing protein [Methylococcales bacterium]|nr:(2Fe-2S) ferredoxin domain-containing protein [Methylococcales bacterium]